MERCFAVDKATMVKFDDFDDLLALAVDVTFDLGNVAFIHVDGGNDASFHPVTHLTTCARITSVFCSPSVPWDDSTIYTRRTDSQ